MYRSTGLTVGVVSLTLAACGGRSDILGTPPAAPSPVIADATPGSVAPILVRATHVAAGQALGVQTTAALIDPLADFPPRNEPFAFRSDLEDTYLSMGRPAVSTFVDPEGDVVWTQEYLRYRVHGCGHADAVQRVFDQINGRGIAPTCGADPMGAIAFPPRNEPFDFRLQLEALYRDVLRRAAVSSRVDLEGQIVWTQEYLRYRLNACSHAEATSRVLSQIATGVIAPTCGVACAFEVSPSERTFPSSGGTGTFEIRTNRTDCRWTVDRDAMTEDVVRLRTRAGIGTQTVTYDVVPIPQLPGLVEGFLLVYNDSGQILARHRVRKLGS